jgi:hypothetical protein
VRATPSKKKTTARPLFTKAMFPQPCVVAASKRQVKRKLDPVLDPGRDAGIRDRVAIAEASLSSVARDHPGCAIAEISPESVGGAPTDTPPGAYNGSSVIETAPRVQLIVSLNPRHIRHHLPLVLGVPHRPSVPGLLTASTLAEGPPSGQSATGGVLADSDAANWRRDCAGISGARAPLLAYFP